MENKEVIKIVKENSVKSEAKPHVVKTMESFKLPMNLVLEGNLSKNWKKFKQSFEIFMIASGYETKESKAKTAILLNLIGDEAVELFNTLTVDDRNDYVKVLKAFSDHCDSETNEVYERFVFYSRNQKEGEPFDKFYIAIKQLAKSCEFDTQEEKAIRDRIILGVFDKKLQNKLLKTKDIKMADCAEECRLFEMSSAQIKEVQKDHEGDIRVDEVNRNNGSVTLKKNDSKTVFKRSGNRYTEFQHPKQQTTCYYCSGVHKKGHCPAYGKICGKCGRKNHITKACKSSEVNEVALTGNFYSDDDSDEFMVGTVDFGKNKLESQYKLNIKNSQPFRKRSWFQKANVEDEEIEFKLDTGAEVNIISYNIFKKLDKQFKIRKINAKLKAFGGGKVSPIGVVSLNIEVNNCSILQDFVIVDVITQPLLGLDSCINLGLIHRVDLIKKFINKEDLVTEYKDVFIGLGCFQEKCKLLLKEGAVSSAKPPRRIPIALKGRLRDTLDEMEQNKIISKTTEAREWIHNLVLIEKPNGKIRVCLDPKELNLSLKDNFYQIPTVEDLTLKLSGSQFYSVLDLKDGFWQIELEEESKKLCTFSTPIGMYQFERMPFGLKVAPEKFQQMNEKNFGDIDGTFIYIDDILIIGKTIEEHDQILEKVLDRARHLNIKFNPKKIQLRVPEVKYLGFVFTKDGYKCDPARTKAIVEMDEPRNSKELQRFLGMVNYLRSFLPNLSEITSPLRELLKKNVVWQWLPIHSVSITKIKKMIQEATNLYVYDSKKELTLECDASKKGLGSCLKQEGNLLSFGSRSLTPTEIDYAQIEKEMLAIYFGTQKYDRYIYGRKVTVHTDHKPLVSIMTKEIGKINSSRLKRIRMKLLKYDLDVKYVPGKYLHVSDHLSRSYLKDETGKLNNSLDHVVHSVNVSEEKLKEFRKFTQEDNLLIELSKLYFNGWPNDKSKLTDALKYYWKFKDNLYVDDGIVFIDENIFVPIQLRKSMLKLLHESHFGITKTKKRAKSLFYWPYMSSDIDKLITSCKICAKFQNSNWKEPLIPHEVPNFPFEKIGSDICEIGDKMFLIIVDYFSKWIEIIKISKKTAGELIGHFKKVFATHGICRTLIADNMPYNSYEFKDFCKEWNFEINTSSPMWPISNGMSERSVQTAKNMLKKCLEDSSDINLTLLEYRNIPASGLSLSPSEILMGRRTRTKIPISSRLLKTNTSNEIKNELKIIQGNYKQYYDRSARERSKLMKGDSVYIQKKKIWTPGKIIEEHSAPRSYIVQDEDGRNYRRNSHFLKKDNSETNLRFNLYKSPDEINECPEVTTSDLNINSPNVIATNLPEKETTTSNESPSTPSTSGIYKTKYGRTVIKPTQFNSR